MNAQVVTVSSRRPTESYYHFDLFLESLRRFAEYPTVLGPDREWHGLMTKPNLYREWLRAGNNTSDRLILCDAWDVIFAAHPHGIGDRCAELFGDAIVFNGEKGCWPREDLREHFPDDGSPWRFLNSGFLCGPADKILAMLEAMPMEEIGLDRPDGKGGWIYPNDQGEFQELYTKQPVQMYVDTQCVLAQTLSACVMSEFDFDGERIQNRVTGTYPGVFHLNGGAKNTFMEPLCRKLNLP